MYLFCFGYRKVLMLLKDKVEIIVSPGTWVYWDSQYDNFLPGEFEFAAFVLAQVMDTGENQITLNLGHKRWAADQGEIQIFSEPELILKSFSEEHTVLYTDKSSQYKIGDYIIIGDNEGEICEIDKESYAKLVL